MRRLQKEVNNMESYDPTMLPSKDQSTTVLHTLEVSDLLFSVLPHYPTFHEKGML